MGKSIGPGARVRLLMKLDRWSLLDTGSEGAVEDINEMPSRFNTKQI
jgi:hypothetical protein